MKAKAVTTAKQRQPDRREYTLMIVPHHGQAVFRLRLPIRWIKWTAAGVAVVAVALTGLIANYKYELNTAHAERSELYQLRQVSGAQVEQIEQLAKATAALQEDMTRLNSLDAELRRLVNTDGSQSTSRSGVARPAAGSNGQGGPAVKPSPEDLIRLVNDIQLTAKAREQSLQDLKSAIVDKQARLAATPSIWPTNGDVTSRFGWRSSPWGGGSDWHPGIDIANDYGTPISVTADGVVVFSGWYGGYGKMIQVDHGNGITTIYAHNSENVVEVGQTVKKGDLVAYMGSTGLSTGSHLHYEVRVNGKAVNPASFL